MENISGPTQLSKTLNFIIFDKKPLKNWVKIEKSDFFQKLLYIYEYRIYLNRPQSVYSIFRFSAVVLFKKTVYSRSRSIQESILSHAYGIPTIIIVNHSQSFSALIKFAWARSHRSEGKFWAPLAAHARVQFFKSLALSVSLS